MALIIVVQLFMFVYADNISALHVAGRSFYGRLYLYYIYFPIPYYILHYYCIYIIYKYPARRDYMMTDCIIILFMDIYRPFTMALKGLK